MDRFLQGQPHLAAGRRPRLRGLPRRVPDRIRAGSEPGDLLLRLGGPLRRRPARQLRLPGLDPLRRYRVSPVLVGRAPSGLRPPRWWASNGRGVSGAPEKSIAGLSYGPACPTEVRLWPLGIEAARNTTACSTGCRSQPADGARFLAVRNPPTRPRDHLRRSQELATVRQCPD